VDDFLMGFGIHQWEGSNFLGVAGESDNVV